MNHIKFSVRLHIEVFGAAKAGDSLVSKYPIASMVPEMSVENIGELVFPISRLEECMFKESPGPRPSNSNLARWSLA